MFPVIFQIKLTSQVPIRHGDLFFVKLFASRLRRKLNYFTHAYIAFDQVSVNSDPDLVQKTSHRSPAEKLQFRDNFELTNLFCKGVK